MKEKDSLTLMKRNWHLGVQYKSCVWDLILGTQVLSSNAHEQHRGKLAPHCSRYVLM